MRAPTRLHKLLVPLVLALTAALVLLAGLASQGALGSTSSPSSPCTDPTMKAKSCAGLVELHVRDVIPIEEAHTNALVLVSNDGTVLPIFVDRPEAVAIAFQLAHRPPPHPLPEELLSKVIHGMGGKVVEVRIRNIRDDDSKCRILIRQGNHYVDVASRPSDAVAAALSVGARIYVPSGLLKKDGITKREIDDMRKHMGIGGSGAGPGTTAPPSRLDGGTHSGDIKL